MNEQFKIFLEALKGGKTEKISITTAPDFLDVNEENLHFTQDVNVSGEAYIADDTLVLHFDATAHAIIPCSICNAPVETTIQAKNFYHAEPLEDIKNGSFYFQDVLRETLLLETPAFAECCQGQCPKRQEIGKYLKTETSGHKPFADITLDQFK